MQETSLEYKHGKFRVGALTGVASCIEYANDNANLADYLCFVYGLQNNQQLQI